jgi:hypothetical protein
MDNKLRLCQTDFSCNNGKRSVSFFQIFRVILFDEKTKRNQRTSTDNVAPIRNVLESKISTFQMAYTPTEYETIDKQLVVFRGKCIFRLFVK